MIECERCGGFFHADDINDCPVCGVELCEECYDMHVKACLNPKEDDDEYEDESSDISSICPECGELLELDINYDYTKLICNNCAYEQDVTELLW